MGTMMLRAVLNLQASAGVGEKTQRRIIEAARFSKIPLDEIAGMGEADLAGALGLTAAAAAGVAAPKEGLDNLAEELERLGAGVLVTGEEGYPAILESRLGADAPPVFFYWGSPAILNSPSMGVSGARSIGERSGETVRELTAAAAADGIAVVSGYADGADTAGHLGALEGGGATVAVLPMGLLHFRVRSAYGGLFNAEDVLVLSQFPPRLAWQAHNAMSRNRIICALSRAVLLVEPGKSGGTMMTGRTAQKLNIPVFLAAPDGEPAGEGAGHFLQRGAKTISNSSGDAFKDLLNAARRTAEAPDEQGSFF
jgi:DNA processing protein